MRQYFYVVMHSVVGDDMNLDHICLQECDAISFGRKLATRNEDYSVYLYKQLIARTGKPEFVKSLTPYKTETICHQ